MVGLIFFARKRGNIYYHWPFHTIPYSPLPTVSNSSNSSIQTVSIQQRMEERKEGYQIPYLFLHI